LFTHEKYQHSNLLHCLLGITVKYLTCVQKHSLEHMGPLTTHWTVLVSLWAIIMLLLCHGMCDYTLWQLYWRDSSVHRSYRCPRSSSWNKVTGS